MHSSPVSIFFKPSECIIQILGNILHNTLPIKGEVLSGLYVYGHQLYI